MIRAYKPHIPKTRSQVLDQLSFMLLKSPTFRDSEFPGRSVETAFLQLNEGLSAIRKKIGEQRYGALAELSARMRAHFESDPEDKNGGTREGRELVHEMIDILEKR